MAEHHEMDQGSVHHNYNWIYANEAAREAETDVTAADLYKKALQLSDYTEWILIDEDPVTWNPIGGSIGVEVWEQVLDENGVSFASWTSGGGTWSSDGTQITQTDTAAAYRTAKFNTQQPLGAGYILEAEVKAIASGAGGTHVVGLIIGYDGSTSGQGAAGELYTTGTRQVRSIRGFTTQLLAVNQSWSDDQYYKLRIVSSGGFLTVYVDDVLILSSGSSPANSGDARFVGLVCYACAAHFKNIKGWRLTPPS